MPRHRTKISMLRCAFLATIGLLASAAPLPAQTAPTESPPEASSPAIESPNNPEPMEDAQPGDHWTYEFRDDITGDVKIDNHEYGHRRLGFRNQHPECGTRYSQFRLSDLRSFVESDQQRHLEIHAQ